MATEELPRVIHLGDQVATVLSTGTPLHDVAIVDTLLPPGAGAGRHVHFGHEEAFYVVAGTMEITVGDTTSVFGPGGFAMATTGQSHSFRNVGDTDARVLALYGPASALDYIDDLAAVVRPDGSADAAEMSAFYDRHRSGAG